MAKARVEFTPTREDYVAAARAAVLNIRQPWYFGISNFGPLLLFQYLVLPWTAGRRAAREERLRSTTLYEVDDDGVLFRTDYVDSRIDWGSFREIVVTDDFYFLVFALNRFMYQFIPRRAFASEQDEEPFHRILAARVHEAQPRATSRARLVASILLTLFLTLCCLLSMASFYLQQSQAP